MPRVRAPNAAPTSYAESPVKKLQIPLNDDNHEKAARLHSRKLLANKQLDQLKAAATSPARKSRKSLGGGSSENAPHTPSQAEEEAYNVGGTAVTPMKRVPLLANFEEWMKMATDNKINAANSWNFALIDYFHDMSLLREGDGVNFQKASCTLDGCVKIYTSRVDSVVTETGKLLSGLADGSGKKRKGAGEEEGVEGAEGEEEDGEEGGARKKGRGKKSRSAEATLVTSFEQLRLKKMELEFSVDPLFKKAAADFDEGGAKGLLMNHLSIDRTGRIVFDSSDDVQEDSSERRDSMEPEGDAAESKDEEVKDGPIDMASLASRFFPDLDRLDTQDICPSLKTFELGAGEGSLDLPFLKAPENWRDEHPEGLTPAHPADEEDALPGDAPAFDMDSDDDDVGGAAFDLPPETGFGEGGEAWARDAALHPQQMRVYDNAGGDDVDVEAGGEVGTFDTNSAAFGVRLQQQNGDAKDHENILAYFDTALQKNWAGPEHWKIARVKDAHKSADPAAKKVRKEKEPFEIDFLSPMTGELAGLLGEKAKTNATISLPRTQWRSKTRNLLPDDKHFHSADLLKLFLKPRARIGGVRKQKGRVVRDGEDVDEAYWAAANGTEGVDAQKPHPMDDDDAPRGDYDADFFADDALLPPGMPSHDAEEDDDGVEFADARENFSPTPDLDLAGGRMGGIDSIIPSTQGSVDGGAFGAQLVAQSRRSRPEYVQYARTAKKVDVRRLKENMWRGCGFGEKLDPPQTPARAQVAALPKGEAGELRFTDIMNNLQTVYPKQQMSDISTSYGFICLLHLANEKGLVVENTEGWADLVVRVDDTAVDLEAGGD